MLYYSKQMWKSLQKKLAIDLGSAKIKMVVVDEPLLEEGSLSLNAFHQRLIQEDACVAIKKKSGQMIAIGRDALEMRGRLENEVEVVFPFQASQIIHVKAAKFLLQELFKKIFTGVFMSPIVMVTTAAELSEVNQQALTQLLYDFNFSEVYLVSQPLAAAIGAGLPVALQSGVLFLQLGASRKEAGIISLGSVLLTKQSPFAGTLLREKIISFLEQEYQLQLSQSVAEKCLQTVASVTKNSGRSEKIIGKSIETGAPLETTLTSEMIFPIMKEFALDTEHLVMEVLKVASPELVDDILDRGLLLAGALAEIDGLEYYLIKKLGIPVAVVDEPNQVALQGTAIMLGSLEQFRNSFAFQV